MRRTGRRITTKRPSAARSRNMAAIRGSDTSPERAVEQILRTMRFRFDRQRRDLPGRPDIVLPRHRLAIQVHGCFWHRHPGCRFATWPKSNVPFWIQKFRDNIRRDKVALISLRRAGWRTLVIWACALKADPVFLKTKLRRVVHSTRLTTEIPTSRSRNVPCRRKRTHGA